MGFLTYFLVLSISVVPVSGFSYKCHRDICNSGYQFCNDGEERCNICTPEQCQADVAKHIFNQCEVKCRELAPTTAKSTEPTTTSTAIVPTQDKLQDLRFLTPINVTLAAGMLIVLSILIVVLCYVKRIDRNLKDPEKAESETYSTISTGGDADKTPLLEQPGIQVVQDEETNSGAHQNKMEDIRTLTQAPAQAAAEVFQSDLADPPSYTTSDLPNNKTPTMVEAVQDSGCQDLLLTEKVPETDFLQQNFRKEIENEKDIGMENTRCKSVQNQSHQKF